MGDAYDICCLGLACIACGENIANARTKVEVGECYLCCECARDPSVRNDYGLSHWTETDLLEELLVCFDCNEPIDQDETVVRIRKRQGGKVYGALCSTCSKVPSVMASYGMVPSWLRQLAADFSATIKSMPVRKK